MTKRFIQFTAITLVIIAIAGIAYWQQTMKAPAQKAFPPA